MGLLGASTGIVLGLIEAGCLRQMDLHLPVLIWFLAPLLTSLTFGLLSLVAGLVVSLLRPRLLGMAVIACWMGFAGEYLALVLRFSQTAIGLQQIVTPHMLFAGVFAWVWAALWATRRPDSPLGFLARPPLRLWSRTVLVTLAGLAAALVISTLPDHWMETTTRAESKVKSPNIVLIMVDTARADHLSSYGYFRQTTPNIERLAEGGVLFENAIAPSCWTLPSTFSMFTGLLPHQHGVGTPRAGEPRTLAELLRLKGYETAGFNANPYYGILPLGLGRGFETYVDSSSTLGYNLDLTRVGRDYIEPYSEEWFHHSRFKQFTAHQLNHEVYRWFDHRSDRPYFLFLDYNDAHEPYEVPSPYDHLYGEFSASTKQMMVSSDTCRFHLSSRERDGAIAAYDNALHYIDTQVGELVSFLKRSPEWSNTYVIVTADHGEGFGEHEDTYSHGLTLYREALHVPLIVAGPGIPARVRLTEVVRTQKIFATVLEWAGVKGAVLRRGSLERLWSHGYVPQLPDEPTISEVLQSPSLPDHSGLISITTREWHLIYRPDAHSSRLYHWATDPAEQQNLAEVADNQAVLEHLKARLLSIVRKSCRPWRDPGYLVALTEGDFWPAMEARKALAMPAVGPLLPGGVGAAQTLFPPNPEAAGSDGAGYDEELVKSIPYGSGR